jgi:hypothetical protein
VPRDICHTIVNDIEENYNETGFYYDTVDDNLGGKLDKEMHRNAVKFNKAILGEEWLLPGCYAV